MESFGKEARNAIINHIETRGKDCIKQWCTDKFASHIVEKILESSSIRTIEGRRKIVSCLDKCDLIYFCHHACSSHVMNCTLNHPDMRAPICEKLLNDPRLETLARNKRAKRIYNAVCAYAREKDMPIPV